MTASEAVLFEEQSGNEGSIGIITLNRPQVLNSLNHTMINAMYTQLKSWAEVSHIKAVVIRAADGRAFCAGGDLRATYERFYEHDIALRGFFRDEYQLNRLIFHFPKPYIALLDGITMGGGVGISIHGSHRIATERLLFAMPETGIGFFPDVGGTYFLPRLPGEIGTYLGLTGARLTCDDCVAIQIAQYKVARESLSDIVTALADCAFGEDAHTAVTEVIEQFHAPVTASALTDQMDAINGCFAGDAMDTILQALQQCENAICRDAESILKQKSPTSLKVTLQALRQGKKLDFDACMRQEYRLVCRFLQAHDFSEGIRAVIIDKDQTPHWKPATLSDVKNNEINKYFEPLTEELV